jgi:hypothetical protein
VPDRLRAARARARLPAARAIRPRTTWSTPNSSMSTIRRTAIRNTRPRGRTAPSGASGPAVFARRPLPDGRVSRRSRSREGAVH